MKLTDAIAIDRRPGRGGWGELLRLIGVVAAHLRPGLPIEDLPSRDDGARVPQ